MTDPPTDNEPDVALWVALVRAQRRALNGIDAALKAQGLPPLTWYDALLELRRAEGGLRPKALEGALLLEQYNVSRLVERLVSAGLVARRPDPEDGRARLLMLTPAGSALLRQMWPVYRGAVRASLGAALSQEEATALTAQLRKLSPPAV